MSPALQSMLSIATAECKAKALAIIGEDNLALMIASEIASIFNDFDLSPTKTADALGIAISTAGARILSTPLAKRPKSETRLN